MIKQCFYKKDSLHLGFGSATFSARSGSNGVILKLINNDQLLYDYCHTIKCAAFINRTFNGLNQINVIWNFL